MNWLKHDCYDYVIGDILKWECAYCGKKLNWRKAFIIKVKEKIGCKMYENPNEIRNKMFEGRNIKTTEEIRNPKLIDRITIKKDDKWVKVTPSFIKFVEASNFVVGKLEEKKCQKRM